MNLKSFKIYPKYITTIIVSDFLQKENTKENTIYTKQVDDLIYKCNIQDSIIVECLITKNNIEYDYFIKPNITPDLKC